MYTYELFFCVVFICAYVEIHSQSNNITSEDKPEGQKGEYGDYDTYVNDYYADYYSMNSTDGPQTVDHHNVATEVELTTQSRTESVNSIE